MILQIRKLKHRLKKTFQGHRWGLEIADSLVYHPVDKMYLLYISCTIRTISHNDLH